ncbi:protoporphyrinogen oxidase [Pseudonocardia sulfidoxydans NBRC 16205]|uniref:Coproporphyrinogen III oxidase n=1 Tax=Pseudonocardia sulfidoxydans NBRC 16205 TaxID=1223511 RepID=A0A511DIC6_9PSEU|nr:protoporphyrinogen oxidase [Pseudonocardia sulfidoxydans]GEL24559.1 protoporphyrinogen oxidase [Pseudonocardia sulfidoxydans NBRC 16205]
MTAPAAAAAVAPVVAVVGAGVSGLAAAHRLRTLLGAAARIVVCERASRTGGVLRTVDLAGVAVDVGAEAFLARRPEVPALLAELGLTGRVVHPTTAVASIRAGGRTGPLPTGTLLGVPTGAARLDGVLTARGLAAVAAEPTLPLDWEPGGDVALGGMLRARFGPEIVDRVADPLLGGVYAGRVDTLGLRATIPALAAALDAGAASLTEAASGLAGPTAATGPVFGGLDGGYRVLLDALTAAARPELRLDTTVRSLSRTPTGWRLTLGPVPAPEHLDVDAVVLAVPAPAARKLLADVVPAAAAAAGRIELASSVVVAMAYRAVDAAGLPATSGVLVAADEPLSIKAATHTSTKWGHLAPDATDGLVRLRASLGRFGEAATLQVDDAALVVRVRADLAALHGITAAPAAVHVQRWGGGLPQYAVGHVATVATLEAAVAAEPRLAVAGSALHGVGVPACIGTARAAAERVAAAVTAAAS